MPPSLADAGRAHIHAGRIDEAIAALAESVRTHPNAIDLSDLAHALLAANRVDDAEDAVRRALKLDRNYPIAHCNLGAVHRARGEFKEAANAYAAAAKLQPSLFEAHLFEAICNAQAGSLERAARAFARALELRPDPMNELEFGVLLQDLHHPREALPYLRRAATALPDQPEPAVAMTMALAESDQLAEAQVTARTALQRFPDRPELHYALGLALQRGEQDQAAHDAFATAVRLEPKFPQALAALGGALLQLRKDQEGLEKVSAALEMAPNDETVRLHYVRVIVGTRSPFEAEPIVREAVSAFPQSRDLRSALAAVLIMCNRADEAIAMNRQMIREHPEDRTSHLWLGLQLLRRGEFAEGWKEYEYREKASTSPGRRPWDGKDLFGKPILLRHEQGAGDTIHFVRYATLVHRERRGQVIVETSEALAPLVRTVAGVELVVTSSTDTRAAAAKVDRLLLDLPRLFGTDLSNIPASVPYVSVPPAKDSAKRDAMRQVITDGARAGEKRVGLVWAGNPQYAGDRERSIDAKLLAPITSVRSVRCFSLAVGATARRDAQVMKDFGIVDLSPWLSDFGETAAAIEMFDLVISVDTAPAHLAGAMGKPVWTMIPLVCDWRWMNDREDSPWYPTMRLFRQRNVRDWPDVIGRVAKELEKFVS